jgi:hypothetical protein
MQLAGEDPLILLEDENRAIDSWRGNPAMAAREIHQWNEA